MAMGKKKGSIPTLDLHGYKVDQVYDAVDKFIMKHQNKSRLRIMPGKGTGVVRKELISYLKQGQFPWEYELMDNGSRNTGSVIVIMD